MNSFDVSQGARRGRSKAHLDPQLSIRPHPFLVAILVMLLMGCTPNEDGARRRAIRAQQPQPCVEFLERFPESPFRTEVQAHLDQLIGERLETSLRALLVKPPDYRGALQSLQSFLDARATNALLLNNYAVLLAHESFTTTNLVRACELLERACASPGPVSVPDVSVCVFCERLPWPMATPNKLQVFLPHASPLKESLLKAVARWSPDQDYIIFPGEVFLAPVRAGRWDHRKADPPDGGFILRTEIENNLKTMRMWVDVVNRSQ